MSMPITPLHQETRSHLTTAEAAIHLNRATQTLRIWAMRGNGAVSPIRMNGRLAWPVESIKMAMGLQEQATEQSPEKRSMGMKFHAFEAMRYARRFHAQQVRRYTGNPYSDHLAEVAGIVASVAGRITIDPLMVDIMISVAWLHDIIEDQRPAEDVQGYFAKSALRNDFGDAIAEGVWALSDLEAGNRAERKAASRARLSAAPGWVQTIKVADLISNTSSIVKHDPTFAVVYLEEKRLLLDVLTKADPELVKIAREQCREVPRP